ncbi:MAG: HAD family hydrolase [Pseudomonadota bacterium]
MTTLALFDLDHTLLPIDSDYEWGRYLVHRGLVDIAAFEATNAIFFKQYQAGTLDSMEYLDFTLGTLARFPRTRLDALHAEFMRDVVNPALLPSALALVRRHREAGDLVVIATATNRFVTAPIARAFEVDHLLAAVPEEDAQGNLTGKLLGTPSMGAGKVTHLKGWLADTGRTLDHFERSYFYSDSHNDLPLLSIVTHPVATNPNAILSAHAIAHGWPILQLFNQTVQ